ncbi:hypothetical protein QUA56_18490 [Microcoleus sp. N3A4]|uniref:hypothetical protein n=1 Tax=Microcoleus sp. N3A4 TaxID=3055379 RepID=UPI002FD279DC
MKFYEALDKTLEYYGITAKWLSEQSGVSQQMISQFRKGKQRVYSDSLEAMISSLPLEPQRYLFSLFLGDRVPVFLGMDETELAEIMDDIAEIIRKKTVHGSGTFGRRKRDFR